MPPKRRNTRSLKNSMKNKRNTNNVRYTKIPINIQNIFYNQNYLYVISLISILYFLMNAINHNYITLISFMIIGVFTFATYSKNMALVLTISCMTSFIISIFVSIYKFLSPKQKQKEGLTDKTDSKTPKDKPEDDTKTEKKATEKLSPLQPAPIKRGKHSDFDVDLSSTLQQSYGMLNDLLDNDGISNLTGETKRLISEQKKLFESMNSMTPLISQAKEMLGMFNTDDFKQMEGLARKTMSGSNTPFKEGLEKKVGGSSGVPNPKPYSGDLDMRANTN